MLFSLSIIFSIILVLSWPGYNRSNERCKISVCLRFIMLLLLFWEIFIYHLKNFIYTAIKLCIYWLNPRKTGIWFKQFLLKIYYNLLVYLNVLLVFDTLCMPLVKDTLCSVHAIRLGHPVHAICLVKNRIEKIDKYNIDWNLVMSG